jgi:D-3-phosphoglycerate dehydrogenase
LRQHHEVTVRVGVAATELIRALDPADVLIVRSGITVSRKLIQAAGRLRLIVRAGVGIDNIDLDAAREARITVANVPGASANAVAEFAFGLLLAVGRNIALADRQVRAGIWQKAALGGIELREKTLGLIGIGAIGGRIAELGQAFGMIMLGYASTAGSARREALARRGVELVGLDSLLGASDVVSVQVPLTEQTAGLLDSARLAKMRRTAYLINVSRAGVVPEQDLLDVLKSCAIAGAGLDVVAAGIFSSDFAKLDNVVITPHIGAMSMDSQRRIGELVADSISAFWRGEQIPHRVC